LISKTESRLNDPYFTTFDQDMASQVLPPPQPAHTLNSSSFTEQHHPAPVQRTNYGSPIDPNDTPLAEIRERYARNGYVWLKNVIPRSDVYDMRERYFRTIAPTGLLAAGTSPRDGIFDTSRDPTLHQGLGAAPEESAQATLDDIHASSAYHEFLAHPSLREWVRRLTQWDREVVLKRGLIRHNVPGSKCPSGIHYDQLFLRAGDPVFVTAWVPIGDCAADGGGLMYLEDSCELGEKIERRFAAEQDKEGMPREERISAFNHHMGELGHLSHDAEAWAKEDGLGKRWLVADYEAGDVVFHSPWMIHASSQNSDGLGRIRLASDLRFYEEGAKLDERWTRPFYHGDGL
jgi:phytanoyl-CoA hydroxylase